MIKAYDYLTEEYTGAEKTRVNKSLCKYVKPAKTWRNEKIPRQMSFAKSRTNMKLNEIPKTESVEIGLNLW